MNITSLIEIDDAAFEYSGLKNVHLPPYVQYIGTRAFGHCYNLEMCNLASLHMSDVEYDKSRFRPEIGEMAFENCPKLERVILSDRTRMIGKDAFRDCTSLKSIRIPQGVEYIEDNAFGFCTSLSEVEFIGGISPRLSMSPSDVFNGCDKLDAKSIAAKYYDEESFAARLRYYDRKEIPTTKSKDDEKTSLAETTSKEKESTKSLEEELKSVEEELSTISTEITTKPKTTTKTDDTSKHTK